MSDDEIDKAVKEAQEYEAQDKKRKEAVDTRNEADSMVFQVEKALSEVGDKVDASEKANVQAEVDALKKILDDTKDKELSEDEVAQIKAAQEKMMTASQGVFTKMYEGMQGAAGAAGAGPAPDMSGAAGAGSTGSSSGDGGNNDDIIDGDFKEI